jgi:pyrroline-5-carboxylate reductase
VDGILELEEGGLRVTLIKAVVQASQRAKELLALRAKDIPGDDVG